MPSVGEGKADFPGKLLPASRLAAVPDWSATHQFSSSLYWPYTRLSARNQPCAPTQLTPPPPDIPYETRAFLFICVQICSIKKKKQKQPTNKPNINDKGQGCGAPGWGLLCAAARGRLSGTWVAAGVLPTGGGPTSTPPRCPVPTVAGAGGGATIAQHLFPVLPHAGFGPAEHPAVTPGVTRPGDRSLGEGGVGSGRAGEAGGAFIKWAARFCQWSECAPWLSCGARRCWSSSGRRPPAGTCPQRGGRTGRARGPWAACLAPSPGGC